MKSSLTLTATLAMLATSLVATAANPDPALNWYRCNTHTHTSAFPNSDANGTPEQVVAWYRAHGYQCVVITDHEFLTDVVPLNGKYADKADFLVLSGQEITQQVVDPSRSNGVRQLHVNGINTGKVIMPLGYPQPGRGITSAQAYERNIAAVRAAGGIAQVNHPNLQWSATPDDLQGIAGPFLLEVWNAFPTSHNLGGTDASGHDAPSTEGFWDALLSRGKIVWGVASDDAHEYLRFDDREAPTPGKAWIVLRAAALTVPAITDALRKGSFYASTGIKVEHYSTDRAGISIKLAQTPEWSPTSRSTGRFITRFVGANGEVLAEVAGDSPRYRFKGDESYVRASIIDSDGRRAWTQPVFRDERSAASQ
jgi:hypothetical protein